MKGVLTILFVFLGATSYSRSHEILFPAKENGLWGYVNVHGEWIIKPTYFKAQPFQEGLAAVKELSKWGFIDKNGSWVIAPEYDLATSFEEGLAAVVFTNRWGYIDNIGQVIIPFTFEKASSFSEGMAVVANKEHYQYIDHNGQVILDGAFTSASPFAEGLAMVEWGDKKGFINQKGQVVLSNLPSTGLFSEGLVRVKMNGKWGFMNRQGVMEIAPQYAGVGRFQSGLAPVKKRDAWGAINLAGEVRIKAQFQSLGNFYHGYAVAQKDDLWGIVSTTGEWVVTPRFHGMDRGGKSVGLRQEMSEHVLAAFGRWKLKGEFEKTEAYQHRLSPENQKRAMDSLFLVETKKHGDAILASSKISLGFYNADFEYFTFYAPGFLPSSIQVPIDSARKFKESWESAEIVADRYGFAGEYFVLKEYAIHVNGATYDRIYTDPTVAIAAGWVDELEVPNIDWQEEKSVAFSAPKAKPGSSDVDIDIPATHFKNAKTFALIIGNEDYKSFQGGFDSEINVSYAATDAEIFSKYVHLTLGVPEKNITLLQNATAGQMKQALAKMNKIAKAFDGSAELIFYYAGHGLPDEISHKPYLIPVDVNGSDLSFAISLDDALNTLAEQPHQRITVFLDACFTGGGRKESLVASRGVKIRPKSPFVRGNLVMFSASSAQQSAFAYEEKAHGMFTYFLLKKFQETQGKVSFKELAGYLDYQVAQHSIVHNNKEQNPEILVSPSLEEVWENFNLLTPYSAEIIGRN